MRLFWGRLDDDAHPARIGNRHPRPSTSEGGAVTLLLRYTLQEGPSRETAGLTLLTKQQTLFFLICTLSLILLQSRPVSMLQLSQPDSGPTGIKSVIRHLA